MIIKAIPTTFRGTQYRSQLEAGWAQWLYEHRFNFQYEQRKFKLDKGIWYLPDFYIPETRTFIEVKGNMERIHKPYELTQKMKQECQQWPDDGIMVLLAGPVGTFFNTEQCFYMGFNVAHCPNCMNPNIIPEYGPQRCRYCGSEKLTFIEKIPVSQKPLKWLLLERD